MLAKRLSNWVIRRAYQRLRRQLEQRTAAQLIEGMQRDALRAFYAAAAGSPAYREILSAHGTDPGRIRTFDDFRQNVPIVSKETLFGEHDLAGLCLGGDLDQARLFWSSSGHSGKYSFAVETFGDVSAQAIAAEYLLDTAFDALSRKTLVVNCLPMGVKIHTRTLPLIESSLREDVITALVKELGDSFDLLILIGEHLFIKRVVEHAASHGVDWSDIPVCVVTGAEYVAENFRDYLTERLGFDPERDTDQVMGINFGLSELSISIFNESRGLMMLRRRLRASPEAQEKLLGRRVTHYPVFMQQAPRQALAENVWDANGACQLVVTMLDRKRKLPIIRYNTEDCVEVRDYHALAASLRELGWEDLLPSPKLPFGIVWGKHRPLVMPDDGEVFHEDVKEALYANHKLAASVTGNFRLQAAGPRLDVLVQAAPGAEPTPQQVDLLRGDVSELLQRDVNVRMIPYADFPYGMTLDYERKRQYF